MEKFASNAYRSNAYFSLTSVINKTGSNFCENVTDYYFKLHL